MKTYTEKELAEAQREAFVTGCRHVANGGYGWNLTAMSKYPLPKIIQPRVVRIAGADGYIRQVKIENGVLLFRIPGVRNQWEPSAHNRVTAQAIVDLYSNPTETVDA